MPVYYNILSVPIELISLEQAKQQLRIDPIVQHEDSLIQAYISEAREIAENYIGRLIGERTLEVKSSDYISNVASEYTPINEVLDIVAKLNNGAEQSVTAELVSINKTEQRLIYQDEPTNLSSIFTTPVTTTLKVGYNANNCPKSLISAMKLIISRLYEFRTDNAQQKTQASHNIMRAFKSWN